MVQDIKLRKADFNQFIQLRNQLVNAADNLGSEENMFCKKKLQNPQCLLSGTQSIPFYEKRDKITAKAVSQSKCLGKCKNWRSTLQMKNLVPRSLAQTADKFSEKIWVRSLE